MKLKFWFLAMAVCVMAMFQLAGCDKTESPVEPIDEVVVDQPVDDGTQLQTVEFIDALSFDELASFASEKGLKVEEIRFKYDDFTVGYTVGGRELSTVKKDFLQKHAAFLELALNQELSELVPNQQAKILLSELASGDLEVRIVTFAVTDPKLLEGWSDLVLSDCDSDHRDDESEPESYGQPSNPEEKSLWHEPWAPYRGWSKVTQGMTLQTFYFNDVRDFGTTHTYEHETQIYDRNFADYDNYWSSNLPHAYLDTRFGDDIDNFTIGSARANQIQTYREYWTYMALRPGSHSTALCRIKGQWGYRFPSWCYSTWCINSIDTTDSMAYLALPNSGVWWQY